MPIDNTKLDFSSEMKYLGVIEDKILDNKNHITYSRNKSHHHNSITIKCFFLTLYF